MHKPPSILLIQDDDFLRTLSYNKLTVEGFNVDTATDGQMGYDKLSAHHYDVCVLDLLLPVRDGFDILRALRTAETLNQPQIIALSNQGSESDIQQLNELGVTHYMIKSSFTLDDLVRTIYEVLDITVEEPVK